MRTADLALWERELVTDADQPVYPPTGRDDDGHGGRGPWPADPWRFVLMFAPLAALAGVAGWLIGWSI